MLTMAELQAALDRERIDPEGYSLGEPFRENSLGLEETAFSFEIFFYERGERSHILQAQLFPDAADEFLRILMEDPTSRSP